MNPFIKTTILSSILLLPLTAFAQEVITLSPTSDDMTPILREKLEKVTDVDLKIVFTEGTYKFLPKLAVNRYSEVTNHSNGLKHVIFPLDNFESIEIDGNGAELLFHGLTAPFQFYNNEKITVKDLSIDWDVPFTFVADVTGVNKDEGWIDVKPWTDHQWSLKNGYIQFPNVDGFSYTSLGNTLDFDKKHQRVAHGAWDRSTKTTKVEQLKDGVLRLHQQLEHYPIVGVVMASKGDREHHRYAPAFQVKHSRNVTFENVVVHHALGMGFLFERTENITLNKVGVYLLDGAKRIISSTADATHFAGCKGDILIDHSRFENMLDDGVNVHGVYTIIDKVINKNTVRVSLGHYEQMGFEIAVAKDEMWFIQQPSVQRAATNRIKSVKVINEQYTDITFENPLVKGLKTGDLLENKTWNPTFTLRNSIIRDHRARNVVLKTPLKIVIENNKFSSMMSSIFFRGETYFWFESGAVEDVLIKNNTFDYFAYSGARHALMYITPRLGKAFNQNEIYDRNIRFENNEVYTFGNRIVWADRVDGLTIKNNNIINNIDMPSVQKSLPLFEFTNSKNIELKNNSFEGSFYQAVKADKESRETIKDDGSIK